MVVLPSLPRQSRNMKNNKAQIQKREGKCNSCGGDSYSFMQSFF